MLYKDTKAMFHSPDDDIDFFDNVTGVLPGDALVQFLFITWLNYKCQQI